MWPLAIGGSLGPFGGAMVTTMVPEVGAGIGVSDAMAAQALTFYMVPFAGLMLFSGTIAERVGRARLVRLAYVAYTAASLVCVVADSYGWFMTGRALMGAANAFTAPLLLALISDLAPPEKQSRSVGQYVAFQGAGQAFSPLVGGAAAGWHYQAAFVAVAATALALAVLTPTAPDPPRTHRASWSALANTALARACGVAFATNLAVTGATLVGALVVSDRFGLSPRDRGLVVAAMGVAVILMGGRAGDLVRARGTLRVGRISLVLGAIAIAAMGVSPWAWGVAVLMAVMGAASAAVRVVINSMALGSTPLNKAGAMSVTMSAQFTGSAVAPLALLPAYGVDPALSFVLAGVVLMLAVPVVTRPGADA